MESMELYKIDKELPCPDCGLNQYIKSAAVGEILQCPGCGQENEIVFIGMDDHPMKGSPYSNGKQLYKDVMLKQLVLEEKDDWGE